MNSIWIGFDPRETAAYAVCRQSIKKDLTKAPITPIRPVILDDVMARNMYWRKTEWKTKVIWDKISDAPMATEFAISRFLTPHLALAEFGDPEWALFMDCDMMATTNFARLFDKADPKYAVICVKHDYTPANGKKMDGQIQTFYQRKNWSSFMLFNCRHPANEALTIDLINTVPGRDLHRFCWLRDEQIGALEPGWNWLVGEQPEPKPLMNIHYTKGGPWFPGYENVPYAQEWREQLHAWAS